MNKTLYGILVLGLVFCGVHIHDLNNRLKDAAKRSTAVRADLNEKFARYFPKLDAVQENFKQLDVQLRKNQGLVDASAPDSRAYRELLFLEYAVTRSISWTSDLLYLYARSPDFKTRSYVQPRLSELAADIQNNIDVSASFSGSSDAFVQEAVGKMRTYGREAILLITQAEDAVAGIEE